MAEYESRSEVARLRRQIELECEAAQRGLTGLAQGAAKHEYINKRMENIAQHHETLQGLVGEPEAITIIADALMEADQKGANA